LPPLPVATVFITRERTGVDTSLRQSSVSAPVSPAVPAGGRLCLGDYDTNRVLVFDGLPTSDDAAATLALGQPDFATEASEFGPSSFAWVAGVAAANGKLFASDRYNNRVLLWAAPPAINGASTSFALGQDGHSSNVAGCARDRMSWAIDVVVA